MIQQEINVIGILAYLNGCKDYYEKEIIVLKLDKNNLDTPIIADGQLIRNYALYPNPNDGNFQLKVELYEKASLSVQVVDQPTQRVWFRKTSPSQGEHVLDFKLGKLSKGVYVLQILAQKDVRYIRFVIR